MTARAGGFCVALEKLPESRGQGNLLGDFRCSFPDELFVLSSTGEVYAVEFPFHMGEDVFPFHRLRQIRGLAVPCTGLGNGFFGSADAGNIGIFPKPVEQPWQCVSGGRISRRIAAQKRCIVPVVWLFWQSAGAAAEHRSTVCPDTVPTGDRLHNAAVRWARRPWLRFP